MLIYHLLYRISEYRNQLLGQTHNERAETC